MKKLAQLFIVLSGISITLPTMADNFTYQGQIIGQDIEQQTIEIDYQTYQINNDTTAIGLFKYNEFGAVIPVGSRVEYDIQPVDNGPPLITQIRVINGAQ